MINYTATYTDQYQLSMAQVYLKKGIEDEIAVFDYFFRKLPFGGGYAVFAGLEEFLDILQDLHFSQEDLAKLKEHGFEQDFIEYLKSFRFRGDIYSVEEGDIIFPTRPVLRVEASFPEAQIIETLLLNMLNFQTLIATKASRMRLVAGDKKLLDFGLRRAQGAGGFSAARAAMVGGFNGTSNVIAGLNYNIPFSGTMAHSFIQRYEDELSAFRDFAEVNPENSVLLVDTYDTLKSGIPNAITIAKELEERGHRLKAVRLDSGDLAYLSRESRRMLDEVGLDYVKIAASNQLDENVIKSLNDQKAPIDIFGVGTNLVTGNPDGAIDGVYKLVESGGKPRIKISESIKKVTIPYKKQVFRVKDNSGNWFGADAIALEDERNLTSMHDPFDPLKKMSLKNLDKEPLLKMVMGKGKRLKKSKSITEIAAYSGERLSRLPDEYKRFFNPHIYKIGITDKLWNKRNILIEEHKATNR